MDKGLTLAARGLWYLLMKWSYFVCLAFFLASSIPMHSEAESKSPSAPGRPPSAQDIQYLTARYKEMFPQDTVLALVNNDISYFKSHPELELKDEFILAAIQFQHITLLEFFIRKNPKLISGKSDGESWLCIAVKNNIAESALKLIELGAMTNQRCKHGFLVLNYATFFRDAKAMKVLKALLEAGANPNMRNNHDSTALHYVMDTINDIDRMPVVKLLVEYGAKIDATDRYRNSILLSGCMKDKADVVEYLIQKGVLLDNPSSYGLNCAHAATILGNLETLKVLNKLNISLDEPDKNGNTPIQYARFGETRWRYTPDKNVLNYLRSLNIRMPTKRPKPIREKIPWQIDYNKNPDDQIRDMTPWEKLEFQD